jgi:hypothetical protein
MPNRHPAASAPEPSVPSSVPPSARRIKTGFPEHPERGLAEVLREALLVLEMERQATPTRTNPDDDDEDPTRRLGQGGDDHDPAKREPT